MKKKLLLILIAILLLPLLGACQPDSEQTSETGAPGETQATTTPPTSAAGRIIIPSGSLPDYSDSDTPDDIVFTPGGYAYRANVKGSGPGEGMESIPFETTVLRCGAETLMMYHRHPIETGAGETRNNIIFCAGGEAFTDSQMTLYAVTVPEGIGLTQVGGGGRPGLLLKVLMIAVSPEVAPGEYAFEIGIEIDGRDYGTIPCTLKIIA
jgi:hypothetical protein